MYFCKIQANLTLLNIFSVLGNNKNLCLFVNYSNAAALQQLQYSKVIVWRSATMKKKPVIKWHSWTKAVNSIYTIFVAIYERIFTTYENLEKTNKADFILL